jgi:3-deoxy-7-phosphoheptulonate synthase
MASGLSMPVGLKNSTDGSLQIAIDAMGATRHAHSFLGINENGETSIVRTTGNPHAHVVLRGGRAKTNYDAESIRAAEEKLTFRKIAAGADGGLQPCKFGKKICEAGRCLAFSHSTKN